MAQESLSCTTGSQQLLVVVGHRYELSQEVVN